MTQLSDYCGALPPLSKRRGGVWIASGIFLGIALALGAGEAVAQAVDCARLQAELAAPDQSRPERPNRYSGAVQKQRVDLERVVSYARSLGCNRQQIIFGPPLPAQCPGLNAQIIEMQGSLARLQTAAGQSNPSAARRELIARYNAYCRGAAQAAAQPQPRNFFEQLFGGAFLPNRPPPPMQAPLAEQPAHAEEDHAPHGGSQAVCVRSCDGGFFPLNASVRRDPDQLTNLCQALCPNASVSVYTRAPYSEISSAVSLDDGSAYSDLPNALKFQKSFEPSCTCKPPEQSWAQALAGAERLIGQERRGDIFVTEEKSVELSAPATDGKKRPKPEADPTLPPASNSAKAPPNGAAPLQAPDQGEDAVGPDGVKRRVRQVGPTL